MKEENIKGEYQRKVDKSLIPTCNIMGVNIAAINMNWLLKYLDENLSDIKGDYICVSNVHTTVTSYENAAYCAVQNGGLMAIPDGGPLSSVGRKRGYSDMDRTTGPSLMGEIFKISAEKGYRHYFYGSTEETLKLLEEKLQENYPGIQIAGMYAMGYGFPVVSTNVGGIPKIVHDGENGYCCDPGDVNRFAKRITKILLDGKERKSFGEASWKIVKEGYSLEAHLNRIEQAYKQVLLMDV